MLSVWVLALCLLISGGISEVDAEETSSKAEESEETTSTTPLSGPIFSYAETNPKLQKYQDAWKFVTSNETFTMKYRNFNTNPTGENTTMCVSATMIEMNETSHYVLHNITYLNTTSNKTIPFKKTYYVISSDGYTIKNVLNGSVARREGFYTNFVCESRTTRGKQLKSNESELYPFAFADKNCAVIRKDSCSNESFKACELWAYETAVEEELSCCDFVFDLLCSRGYKQITYDSERCKT